MQNNIFIITIFKNKLYHYIKDIIIEDNNSVLPILTTNYNDAHIYNFLSACENRNKLNEKRKFKYNNYFLKKVNLSN